MTGSDKNGQQNAAHFFIGVDKHKNYDNINDKGNAE
jgi:hypothetical protein